MSRNFPTEKDNVIDDMDDNYGLALTDAEYDRLRRLSTADLMLVTMLLARADRRSRSTGEQDE